MKFRTHKGEVYTLLEPHEKIFSAQDALDMMADARYSGGSATLLIQSEHLNPDFFDLRTGLAGEVLQKFSTYNTRLAIIGCHHQYKGNAIRDFIRECNQSRRIIWVESIEEAISSFS